MKRNKITYPKVEEIKPILFWKECRFCGKEFKEELGYEISDIGVNQKLYIEYCCNDCAISIEEVKEKIKNKRLDFINSFPGPPEKPTK